MQRTKITKKDRLRVLGILGFCAFLLVQGIFSFVVVPEPYPTVRMPAFVSGPTSDGLFKKTVASVQITYVDGSTVEPHPVDLMEGFRFSAARASMDYMFHPDSTAAHDSEVTGWLRNRAMSLGSGEKPKYVDFCWQKASVDSRTAKVVNAQPCESKRIEF